MANPKVDELHARRAASHAGGGEERVKTHRAKGRHTAYERLDILLDPGSFRELDAFVECSRQLNQAALAIQINDTPEQRAAFDDLRRALHRSVDVIAEVAGKRQEDLPRASEEEMALKRMDGGPRRAR